MIRLQVGAIIDILESNFTGDRSRSAVILANPFVACYNNLTVWDSFAASLSDTENCLTIRFFGYPQDSPLRLADILSNSNENGLRGLAHDRPLISTKDWIDLFSNASLEKRQRNGFTAQFILELRHDSLQTMALI